MATKDLRPALREFLDAAGLAGPGDEVGLTGLTAGIGSELWRVDLPDRTVCVKAALARLTTGEDVALPVSRSGAEAQWLRLASSVAPGRVPALIASDEAAGFFAMEFLPPERHTVWRDLLDAGEVDPAHARAVGELFGALHAASAADSGSAGLFNPPEVFDAVRLRSYLRAPAAPNPDLADRFAELDELTRATRLALVHGDANPKNVLIGPSGPVLLDAEWASFGDPAFDVAFFLNHLLLTAVSRPDAAEALRESALALMDGYRPHVDWEEPAALEARAAGLVPAFALALVDGEYPAPYLSAEGRALVRPVARALMSDPAPDAAALVARWAPRS